MSNISDKLDVKVEGGVLRAYKSLDPNFPGIYVDFIKDGSETSQNVALVEKPVPDSDHHTGQNSQYTPIKIITWQKGKEESVFTVYWD